MCVFKSVFERSYWDPAATKYTASDTNQQVADYWGDLIIVAFIQRRPDHDFSFFHVCVNCLSHLSFCWYTSVCLRTFLCLFKWTKREERGTKCSLEAKKQKKERDSGHAYWFIFLKQTMKGDSDFGFLYPPHMFLGIGLLPSFIKRPSWPSLPDLSDPLRPRGGSC